MKPEDFEWYEEWDTDEDGNEVIYQCMEVYDHAENYRVDLWEYRLGYTKPGKKFAGFGEAYAYAQKKRKVVGQARIVDLKSARKTYE